MAFDPNQPFEEESISFDPSKPFEVEEEKPVGTSFSQEAAQLGAAFKESLGRPLENMGEGFEVLGFTGVANALKGAITEPENYVSAAERFMEPQPGESQFLGFAWQYAPRAAVEQTGQALAAIGGRVAGALAGGAVAGPPGAIAGGFLGPAIIGAAQVIGPVAKERARNNGREVPTNQDLAAATLTAIGSGALDAIGARYLPGGDKATGKFFKRVASSFVGEGLLTEAPQSVIEQVGSTAGTEAGLNINVKQALGEGIIGGTTAFGIQAITYPFTKTPDKQVIRTPEQAAEMEINAKSNEEALNLMGQPADDTKTELINTVNEMEREIANSETLIEALEPNDPERKRLELQVAEAKKLAAGKRGELEQNVGLAPVESEQARLAREIAAPPAESAQPVTPAPAPVAEAAVVEEAAPVSETITEPAPAETPAAPAPAVTEFGFAKEIEAPRENIKKNMIRFASGMSAIGDLKTGTYARGGFKNYGVGFDVGLLSKNAVDSLADSVINLDTQVFIDSGAFSNFRKSLKEQAKGRTVEALDFDKIFEKYDSILDAINRANPEERTDYPRPLMVMPDIIGDQKASLDLIEKYKDRIALETNLQSFTPIIPIPLGELSLSQAYNRILEILNSNTKGVDVDPTNFIVGIPSNAKAVSKEDLANFLRESKPPRIHFLGAAADRNITPLIETVAQTSPETAVTADASKVRSAILNGVTKGKTRKQAIFDALYQEDDPEVVLNKISEEVSKPTAPTPAAPAAEPAGIAVGNRVKTKTTPQSYVVEEVLPQSAREAELGEQYYRIKNERTGEVQTVEASDIKPVKGKGVRKMAAATRNEEYMRLAQDPEANREQLQRMVDEAAKKAGYDVGPVWHSGQATTEFSIPSPRGAMFAWFSTDRGYAVKLGKKLNDRIKPTLVKAYLRTNKILDLSEYGTEKLTKSEIIEAIKSKGFNATEEDITFISLSGRAPVWYVLMRDRMRLRDAMRREGYDSIKLMEGKTPIVTYAVIDSSQIKSADPVTYDDAGNVIPLEERFQAASPDIRRMASEIRAEEKYTPVPEAQRYTFREASGRALTFFGGSAPANFIIVNDSTNPDYEFKAGYDPDTSEIILNRAYIRKGENIEDILTHELGHYIYSDPEFQAAFQNFWESMPEDARAEIDQIVKEGYNKETNEVQIEERQVIAFASLVRKTKRGRNAWEKLKDFIKKWINRVLKTNITLSDQGAMAVFNVGYKRFQSGERIVREMKEGVLKMAPEPTQPAPEKPAAEEKPTMKRYDKKSQIAGVPGIGAAIDTPKGINAKTEKTIQDRVFNSDIVNDNQTKKAWNLIQNLESTNPNAGKNAEAINQLTRETMQDVDADEVVKQTIGAVKLRNELFKYAMKLTAQGDKKMLDYLLNIRLAFGGGTIVEGDPGRLLQAHQSLKNWIVRASEAERQGFFESAAQQFFDTKTPTDEQIQQIKDIFNKVNDVKINQQQALIDELEDVGKAAGVDLPAAIDKQLNNAPGLDPMVVAITNMLKMGGTFIYRKFPSKVEQAVKNTINRGITNYRKKLVSKGANGLETGFWKTMASTEEKPGPLGELDAAQNRALGNIVKSTLVSLGLKGTPPDTKMSIYEQVASILGEQPLGKDKMNLADEKVRGGIEAGRNSELENASEDQADAINSKWDAIQFAWDESMSRSLDMPVSDTMLRRLIANEIKDEKTSIQELATLMDEEPAIGTSRQDRLVNSIIEKVSGITFDGQPTRDYTALKKYLSDMLENIVQARQQKNAAANSVAKVKRDASGDPDKQAQSQIDKLAKIQADPTIFGEKKIDPVRNAVRDALSLKLNIGFTPEQSADIKRNWKGAYVADPNKKGIPTSFMLEMQRLGVSEAAADTLSEIVWKQIEVNAMNRQMEATTKAVEAGPIGGMVQAILDTPLANQQDPDWRKQVILDYLKNAGIRPAQAENIAKLFDLSLRKRFAKAQEEAAIKAAKSIRGGLNPESRRALEKFLKAIRAQVLDPGTDVAKAFGEQMGWTGFTKEQIVKLNELDAIVNDNTKTEAETFVAIEQINKIIDSVSAPPQVKDILASYYVGNILGRITTFTIQAIDPLFFSGFNAVIDSFRNITNPTQLMSVWSNYGRGISNLIRETAFSFKNDVLRSGKIVDYMARQDRQIGRLWDEAEKKWKRGDIKGAMKDGIFGYTAWTFRTLKALDDGAYSLLTTTTLPSYVDAALKRAKVPKNKRIGVMRQILEARELDIKNMVDQGTPRNDAVVYANEKMRGEITKVLTGMNIDAQEVIDSAINDALSRIGKTRFQEDIHGKETEIKDLGGISTPFLRFYEAVAKSVNEKGGSESQKIFYRILLGFPLIPARIFNIAAGYTPLTIYRHALKNRYSLTYGTALQRRQRIIEQMAGTAVLLPLLLLRSNSLDEEDEKEKGFGIYITGQGPSRTMDRETRAQWDKKFDPYSIVIRVGNKSTSIDARAAGPLSVMIYTLGAVDDWENRRKQEGLKTSKDDWRDVHEKASLFTAMYDLAGSFLLTTARRGPTTGVIQGLIDFKSYPDDPIAAISKEVAFSGMPAVPILGTGIVKNLSDLFSQPIDNKTKEGAILSNIPIVGPVAGQPALNAYGQRIGELRVSEKLKKSFGLPFTLITSDTEDDTKLTSLTLKFGNGPTPLRREDVENALKDVISDEEWYLAAKTFGSRNKEKVLAAYNRYDKMKPDRFNDAMNKLTTDSKSAAIRAVKQQRRNRP